MMWIVQGPDGGIRNSYDSQRLADHAARAYMKIERDGPFMVYVCSIIATVDVARKIELVN